MKFFTTTDLTSKASTSIRSGIRNFSSINESADAILAKSASDYSSTKTYDIFLSHSFLDAPIIYGLKTSLEEAGFSVYVYWIEDPTDRSQVTPETAERLRTRMQSCKSLLYATSENAVNSKWMPWELGYFDGIRGKVAICPITSGSTFQGREYLGLYPIMESDLWLWQRGNILARLGNWI